MAADSWGLSWGGTTGSWLTSWASTFVPPPPADPTPTGAGRRKRYFVEIDGQYFAVNDASEARQILQQAQALAERTAEQAAQVAEKRIKRALRKGKSVGPVRVERPVIVASPELTQDIAPYQAEIDRLYQLAAATIELKLLMDQKLREEEEEDLMLLLL